MGGEFQTGQTGLLPATDVTLDGDIIFVSVAYRVGIFGFLSTGDDTIPGNFGLWDQKMAIEWVKANIKSFGGDPSKITLAGYEAPK
jgi:carboxylesterase type B